MSLRDECDCPFPSTDVVGQPWTCPGCGAAYEHEGGGNWRCLLGGLPAGRWSGRIADLSDAALLALADAVTRERAKRDAP